MAAAGPTEYQMMNQRTWPYKSDTGPRFTAFSFMSKTPENHNPRKNNPTNHNPQFIPISSSNQEYSSDNFSQLPNDVLLKIAATFTLPNLRGASQVCKSWCDALRPLREAMLFLKYGKNFKHGRGGVEVNLNKALDSFLKGAARGSTLPMVDAGLLYWEMGKKEQGFAFYRKAALLGDPAGQCNLGISLLQANPPDIEEAIKWLYRASIAGYIRAQYQLALCLHKGRGPSRDLKEAVVSEGSER